MFNAILGLFTSFNPVILGALLSAGAYIALRHRDGPSPRESKRFSRRGSSVRRASRAWRAQRT